MSDAVNIRNINSLHEALKVQREEDNKLRDRIANTEATIETLRAELISLRGLIIASMSGGGNIGPTA